MKPLPPQLVSRPFLREEATALGVTSRMLEGGRFVRVLPSVWRCREHPMSAGDWIDAARLVLPESARTTGLTRIQQLGLVHGPCLPVRFVVVGDHHLAHDEVFLHRTVKLPPTDEVGVTPAAAYLSYCSLARTVDAIKVGDWLLRHKHASGAEIENLALAEPWRAGAHEALWVLPHLDGGARSLPESETRALLAFAGLPPAEVNAPVDVGEDVVVLGDLVYRQWRVLVEYDGAHHQRKREQYVADVDRYALLRAAGVTYVQVTVERLRHARTLVGTVHRALVSAGYAGPPPQLGEHWSQLFGLLSAAVGNRPPGTQGCPAKNV